MSLASKTKFYLLCKPVMYKIKKKSYILTYNENPFGGGVHFYASIDMKLNCEKVSRIYRVQQTQCNRVANCYIILGRPLKIFDRVTCFQPFCFWQFSFTPFCFKQIALVELTALSTALSVVSPNPTCDNTLCGPRIVIRNLSAFASVSRMFIRYTAQDPLNLAIKKSQIVADL